MTKLGTNSAATPSAPMCKPWCGRVFDYVDGEGYMRHPGDGTETCFCTTDCADARRPLHPTTPTPAEETPR